MESVIAIDIGGTNTDFGWVAASGEVLYRDRVNTGGFQQFSELMEYINGRIKQVAKDPSYPITGVGIGAPNGNYFTGNIEYAPNLPWSTPVPVTDVCRPIFGVPCHLDNDANLAALGEKKFGAGKKKTDFITVTLGTGLGSGMVIGDKLFRGNTGLAGELGYIVVQPKGRMHWKAGIRGLLESYVSATGIQFTAYEWLETNEQEDSAVRQLDKEAITARVIFDLARKADPGALSIIDTTLYYLGIGLANYIATNAPQAIILFGGIASALFEYKTALEKQIRVNLPPILYTPVSLLLSALPETSAALLGAASLALHEKEQKRE